MFVFVFTSSVKGDDEGRGRGGDDDWSPTAVELSTWSCNEGATRGIVVVVVVVDEVDADDKWRHKRCFLASIKALRKYIFN